MSFMSRPGTIRSTYSKFFCWVYYSNTFIIKYVVFIYEIGSEIFSILNLFIAKIYYTLYYESWKLLTLDDLLWLNDWTDFCFNIGFMLYNFAKRQIFCKMRCYRVLSEKLKEVLKSCLWCSNAQPYFFFEMVKKHPHCPTSCTLRKCKICNIWQCSLIL